MAEQQPKSLSAAAPRGIFFRVLEAKAVDDEIGLRASALAYSTLASLVPIFAMLLAILSGPAFQETRDAVLDRLTGDFIVGDAMGGTWVIDEDSPQAMFKQSFQNTMKPLAERLGAVSVFGFLVLVATIVLLFEAAEKSFNAIWRVSTQRSFFMRVALATSMMFWGPVMLAVSVSLTQYLSGLLVIGTYFIPTIVTTVMFTAFYMVMPHAKVRLTAALAGGILAALCWEIAKLLFLLYVTRVVSYHKVYGSLGLIPMLFLWVYINWLLILYGAVFAYCVQHRKALIAEWLERRKSEEAPVHKAVAPSSPVVALAVAIEAVRQFQSGGVRASQLAETLHVELALAQAAAEKLVAGGILARVAAAESDDAAGDNDPAYMPACDPKSCLAAKVLPAACDGVDAAVGDGPAVIRARAFLTAISAANVAQFGHLTLADLADEQKAFPSRDHVVSELRP